MYYVYLHTKRVLPQVMNEVILVILISLKLFRVFDTSIRIPRVCKIIQVKLIETVFCHASSLVTFNYILMNFDSYK